MYVPNMIGIPTNGVDLWHHGLRIGERNHKSLMEPPQVEERRKKKERRKKEKGVGDFGKPVTPCQKAQLTRCDSVHVVGSVTVWSLVAPVYMV
jgi:hypothetical protein